MKYSLSRRRFMVAAAGGAVFAIGRARAQSEEPLKLGAILNLSGPTALQGGQYLHGLELAADILNNSAEAPFKVELIAEDMGAAEPARAVTAAQKLFRVDGVHAIANVYTSAVLAVMPLAERAGVLQLSAGASSPALINVSKLFLSNIANAGFEAEVGLSFALRKLNAASLAILYGNDDFGNALRTKVEAVWTAAGKSVLDAQGLPPNQQDVSAAATQLAAANPDVLYLALAGGNVGPAVKQLREAGITTPIISHQGFETPDLLAVAGSAAENSFWTSAAAPGEGNQSRDAYFAAHEARYGEKPSVYSQNKYDLASSLFRAAGKLRSSGIEWNGASLREAMLALGTYEGVTGPFSYREDGIASRELDIKTYRTNGPEVFLTAQQIQKDSIYDFNVSAR